MAVRAQVVGTRHFHLTHRREKRLGAQFPVVSRMAAGTGNAPLIGGGSGELQQLSQGGGSGLMHGRAHRHLDGFQIQTARLTASVEDDAQQLVYFARDFPLDRFGRFFSCGVCSVCSMGRERQIFRLTPTNSVVRV